MESSQILYSRQQAARMLANKSIDYVKSLERKKVLTPIRPSGPRGQVFYSRDELMALAKLQATA